MRAYKGFNKNLQCRGFQYETGKTYEEKSASLCREGFHACEAPLNVFDYYPPGEGSRYCEVDLEGVTDERKNDTKICGTKISVGAEIGIRGLIKAHFDYVREKVTESVAKGDSEAVAVGNEKAATAGDMGAATAGYRGAATAGYRGAATAGDRGAATAGDRGAATAGDRGAATAGYMGAATAGYRGAATAGDMGAATSRGRSRTGENGFAIARGNCVKASGGINAILVLAEEEEENCQIKFWKAFVIDGKKYKPGVWYTLDDYGEVVEAEGEADE